MLSSPNPVETRLPKREVSEFFVWFNRNLSGRRDFMPFRFTHYSMFIPKNKGFEDESI